MAKRVSKSLEAQYKFPRLFQIHLKIKVRNLTLKFRSLMKKIKKKKYVQLKSHPNVSFNIESSKKSLTRNGWAFVDNFWTDDFYKDLLKLSPSSIYFDPLKHPTKSYDIGFIFSDKITNEETNENLKLFLPYKKAYEFLKSKKMCDIIARITNSKKKYNCEHLIMTKAYWGSSVIPHVDSLNDEGSVNLIIFIKSSSGMNSGNLGIWKDNEFKIPIFIPENLNNSMIMYDMSKDFFHGFPPMGFNKNRLTINAKYAIKKG